MCGSGFSYHRYKIIGDGAKFTTDIQLIWDGSLSRGSPASPTGIWWSVGFDTIAAPEDPEDPEEEAIEENDVVVRDLEDSGGFFLIR